MSDATRTDGSPTVVLVHGAFADASSWNGVIERGGGGLKDSVLNAALVPLHYPAANGETATEFAIDPARFRDAFAADLPAEQAALMEATQRPVAELAFSEPSGPPAWKDRPSGAVVATGDKAAGTDVTRAMAERAAATITDVEGSVIMVSQAQAVTEVIVEAVAAAGNRV